MDFWGLLLLGYWFGVHFVVFGGFGAIDSVWVVLDAFWVFRGAGCCTWMFILCFDSVTLVVLGLCRLPFAAVC